MARQKLDWQQELVKDLTKERDFLLEQLAMTRKKDKGSPPQAKKCQSQGADSTDSSKSGPDSSHSSSDPSSDSSSSDEGQKKKKKNSRGKGRKQGKRAKNRKGQGVYQRAKDPEEVVARYRKVLKICRKGRTMGAAFKAVGVDRNTIVVNAPMAELCIAAPEAYAELKESAPKKEKLSSFAQRCKDAIDVDENIVTRIKEYKDSGKLLPITKKN
ncbi:coiled-coil domain-containing protein 106-like isoform X2 [Gadus chalcogrammus]|uniref:coiled-coil domain-containing protein 106-like isoform X2 n=1 Tax=Gadus chalcogrammus TaxID=1042646 RepID=UPI0024C4B974|nr:coiled-coil domain-containing protein 106-like isoform X2 [Gadus chalcogrammus]